MVVDEIAEFAQELIVGDGIFMGENRGVQNTENLLEQKGGVFHFSGDDFVVLFHHELNELDDDLFFVAVHDDIHDDADGFFVHLRLF
jgi:hypothetical protein